MATKRRKQTPACGELIEQSYISLNSHIKKDSEHYVEHQGRGMADWGPVFMAVILFILLSPGLLFQVPGKARIIEFSNFQTSGVSILVHSIIYFGLISIFLLAVHVHMYIGG
ncbi:hypothetical protein ZIOFF_031930 [Zingiber officinale]|uniref:Transmembrane protein n=1 Tax=Zingiber officinale TaxID=94328 RepID=A0A8J5L5A8_ZINOF|nr:hypothetical protein ZIOFF_031930 [Zingiber officinale]